MKIVSKKMYVVKEKECFDRETRLAMIQSLIPYGMERLEAELVSELNELTGEKGKHGKEIVRWTKQKGYVFLRDQRMPVTYQRARNKNTNEEVVLESYKRLQKPYLGDEQTFKKLVNGISMRKYREAAELAPEVCGLSPSSMSRRFKNATEKRLKEFQERRLDGYSFCAIIVDGKMFGEYGVTVALGITDKGKKIPLGLEQVGSENCIAIGAFFQKLKTRGLKYQDGILFVVDGAKGETKAIKEQFEGYGLTQRCQFHKRENILSYLPKKEHKYWSRRIQDAYSKEKYEEAKELLLGIKAELKKVNPSAAGSLEEGLEETLTIHKLHTEELLRMSLKTTNCIESIFSQVERYTGRVSYWKNGDQIQRWAATSLLEAEKGLNKVRGWKSIKTFMERIKALVAVQVKELKALKAA
jgi:transposase-like protein